MNRIESSVVYEMAVKANNDEEIDRDGRCKVSTKGFFKHLIYRS